MISLGCPKNLVDSEVILGNAGVEGLVITPSADEADVIIVNTCSFIDSAKEESIQAILEACELKRASPTPKKVVVAGCLAQRYGADLRKEVPDVDAIIGLGEYDDIGAAIRALAHSRKDRKVFRVSDPTKACTAEVGRFRLTPSHYAYVKISEGCDNPCTFCAIPSIRGGFRSKPISMIEEEVRELVESGAREIILISQDTTSYGIDLTGKLELAQLLDRVAAVDGVEWIRILYVYPSFVTDEMIDAIAGIDKVIKYVDIPLQHISDRMLRRMGRRSNEAKTRALLETMRARIAGLYLRTTFIVGFPGEDEAEFGTLRDFVRDFGFERLGVFPYSEEEGTPAATFADQVPPEVRSARLEEIMLIQQENAFRHNRSRKDEVVRALIDMEEPARGRTRPRFRARSYGEAPEIDPTILVEAPAGERPRRERDGKTPPNFREIQLESPGSVVRARPGDFISVRLTGSKDYDLLGEMVG
ncbi:MAG TPA: 30S ribosomal protein S12 methylthiotransferase RimO [Planctomycetota bacterium]|nr:30S ribosomal protein S12 methylthiotransferase RimO [Planctomycetota bacterium]